MSQYDFGAINATTKSGSALAADLNNFRSALHSSHKGPVAPGYAVAGMLWFDDSGTTTWALKAYDGEDWITVLTVDATNNKTLFTTLQTFSTGVSFAGTPSGRLADLNNGYELYSEDFGTVGTSRVWFEAPDNGEVIIGPRSGSSKLAFHRVRSARTDLEGAVNVSGPFKVGADDIGAIAKAAMPKSGGTFTGDVTVAGAARLYVFNAPEANNEVASKYYVDAMAIGVGQTWQDVTANRAGDTAYQNTAGRPIMVSVSQAGKSPSLQISSDNVTWVVVGQQASGSAENGNISAIVPPSHYYKTTGGFYRWTELR